jgi:hypothetical protein
MVVEASAGLLGLERPSVAILRDGAVEARAAPSSSDRSEDPLILFVEFTQPQAISPFQELL